MIYRRLARTGLSAAIVVLGITGLTAVAGQFRKMRTLTPPIGQLIEQDGKMVHVWVGGTGPDLILLHGASGNLRDFTFRLTDKLTQNFRVIAFDRPGLGYSEALHSHGESPQEQARHLARVADRLGVKNAIIAGHSFGGSVAMAWALERADQVAALVSLAGAVNPWPGELGAWYGLVGSDLGGATVVPLIAALVPLSLAKKSVVSIFEPDAVPDGYLEYIGVDLTLRSKVLRANARQVNGLRPNVVEMSRLYPSLTIPIEIIHGSDDITVPLSVHSEPLAKAVTTANLTVLPGIGHMPQHADPDAAIAAIQRAASRAGLHSARSLGYDLNSK